MRIINLPWHCAIRWCFVRCGCLKRQGTTLFCSALPPGFHDILHVLLCSALLCSSSWLLRYTSEFPSVFWVSFACIVFIACLLGSSGNVGASGFWEGCWNLHNMWLLKITSSLLSSSLDEEFFSKLLRGLNTAGNVYMKDIWSLLSRTDLHLHPLRLATFLQFKWRSAVFEELSLDLPLFLALPNPLCYDWCVSDKFLSGAYPVL